MILRTKDNLFYDVDSYGACSWGSLSQKSLEKTRDGKWYISYADCYDPYNDEWHHEKLMLDVVEELEKLPEGAELVNRKDYECFAEMTKNFERKEKTQ